MARVNAIGTEFVESDVDDIVRGSTVKNAQAGTDISYEPEISKQ